MSSEQLTLLSAASLASHTVLPGSEKARQMTVTSGRNIADLLTLSGPVGSLVKTCLESEQLFSTRCYLTWKTLTTPGGRLLYRLAPSARGMSGKEFLLWPTATNITNTGGAALCKWGGSRSRARLRQLVTPAELNGSLNPEWVEWFMGFPIGWTDLER